MAVATPVDISSIVQQINALVSQLVPLILYIMVLMMLITALRPSKPKEKAAEEKAAKGG